MNLYNPAHSLRHFIKLIRYINFIIENPQAMQCKMKREKQLNLLEPQKIHTDVTDSPLNLNTGQKYFSDLLSAPFLSFSSHAFTRRPILQLFCKIKINLIYHAHRWSHVSTTNILVTMYTAMFYQFVCLRVNSYF